MNDPKAEPQKAGTRGYHAVRRRVPLLLVACSLLLFAVGTANKCLDHESSMNMEGAYSGWVATGAGPQPDVYAVSKGEELCNFTTQEDWYSWSGFCSTLDWDITVAGGEGGYATGFWDCMMGYGHALIWNWAHEWSVDGKDGEEYDCEYQILREGFPFVLCLGP